MTESRVMTTGEGEPPEPIAARFDQAYAQWISALTDGERRAIERWQAPDDRFYQRVQRGIRQGDTDRVADEIGDRLAEAIDKARLPEAVTLWRGQRSAVKTFGVDAADLGALAGATQPVPGFLAASLSREVAVGEFTRPPGPGGAVLLCISVPEGIPAAWVAVAGQAGLRYQFEVLMADRHVLRILDVAYDSGAGVPIMNAEVIWP